LVARTLICYLAWQGFAVGSNEVHLYIGIFFSFIHGATYAGKIAFEPYLEPNIEQFIKDNRYVCGFNLYPGNWQCIFKKSFM
jgi:hypothetical protein